MTRRSRRRQRNKETTPQQKMEGIKKSVEGINKTLSGGVKASDGGVVSGSLGNLVKTYGSSNTDGIRKSFSGGSNNTVRSSTKDIADLGNKINIPSTQDFNVDEYTAKIDERLVGLQDRQKQATDAINEQYDKLQIDTQNQQENEVGGYRSKLVRMGGYLGDSASHVGALIGLEQEHRAEVQSIESRRSAALQEARDAYENNDFKLAGEKYDVARNAKKNLEQSQQNYFNNQIRLQQEERQAAKSKYELDELERTTGPGAAARQTSMLNYISNKINKNEDVDPALMLTFLNTDEAGQITGDYTIPEITSAISSFYLASKNPLIQTVGTPSSGIWQITYNKKGEIIDKQLKLRPQRAGGGGGGVLGSTNPLNLKELKEYNKATGLNLLIGSSEADFIRFAKENPDKIKQSSSLQSDSDDLVNDFLNFVGDEEQQNQLAKDSDTDSSWPFGYGENVESMKGELKDQLDRLSGPLKKKYIDMMKDKYAKGELKSGWWKLGNSFPSAESFISNQVE